MRNEFATRIFAPVRSMTNDKISKIAATYRKRIQVEFALVEPPS